MHGGAGVRVERGPRDLREVALAVALAVAAAAYEQGHALIPAPADLRAEAVRAMYPPQCA